MVERVDVVETYKQGALPYTCLLVEPGQIEAVNVGLIEEITATIHVNGQEIAVLMCSPVDLEALALGFLYNEGIIQSIDEVRLIHPNAHYNAIDVFLNYLDFNPPRRVILTSGCGRGISFQTLTETRPALHTDFATTPEVILDRMRDLHDAAALYHQARGIHTSILGNQEKILVAAEDIGRHNTIDKLTGKALQARLDMRNTILVSSGRISSEMLSKAWQMGVPVIASRSAPTSISVKLAWAWNMCVIGYVHRDKMRVYTHPERLGLPNIPSPADQE
jgi:FdhD protein